MVSGLNTPKQRTHLTIVSLAQLKANIKGNQTNSNATSNQPSPTNSIIKVSSTQPKAPKTSTTTSSTTTMQRTKILSNSSSSNNSTISSSSTNPMVTNSNSSEARPNRMTTLSRTDCTSA